MENTGRATFLLRPISTPILNSLDYIKKKWYKYYIIYIIYIYNILYSAGGGKFRNLAANSANHRTIEKKKLKLIDLSVPAASGRIRNFSRFVSTISTNERKARIVDALTRSSKKNPYLPSLESRSSSLARPDVPHTPRKVFPSKKKERKAKNEAKRHTYPARRRAFLAHRRKTLPACNKKKRRREWTGHPGL